MGGSEQPPLLTSCLLSASADSGCVAKCSEAAGAQARGWGHRRGAAIFSAACRPQADAHMTAGNCSATTLTARSAGRAQTLSAGRPDDTAQVAEEEESVAFLGSRPSLGRASSRLSRLWQRASSRLSRSTRSERHGKAAGAHEVGWQRWLPWRQRTEQDKQQLADLKPKQVPFQLCAGVSACLRCTFFRLDRCVSDPETCLSCHRLPS
jgi:hypothetical protein